MNNNKKCERCLFFVEGESYNITSITENGTILQEYLRALCGCRRYPDCKIADREYWCGEYKEKTGNE